MMNRRRTLWTLGIALLGVLGIALGEGIAQTNNFGVSSSLLNNSFRRAQNTIGRYTANNQVLRRDTVSPYLQLANSNNPTAFQYQNVRAQLDRRNQTNRQNSQLQLLSTQINSLDRNRTRLQSGYTGHPTRFMQYSHYYGLVRRGG